MPLEHGVIYLTDAAPTAGSVLATRYHPYHRDRDHAPPPPPEPSFVPRRILSDEEADERARMDARVAHAVADPTGRLKLYVNGSGAARLSDDVGRVENLREIHCSGSPLLTTLPRSIAKLSASLTILCADRCALTELPEELAELRALRHLDVSHNQLTAFLWDAQRLEALEFLGLAHNRVAYFSPGARVLLRRLQALRTKAAASMLRAPDALRLTDNDFITPTEHLLKPRFARETKSAAPSTPDFGELCGRELLPGFVEDCAICRRTVIVGRPRVHIVFETAQCSPDPSDAEPAFASAGGSGGDGGAGGNAAAASERAGEGGAGGNGSSSPLISVRVPVFYPLCREPKCSLALHSLLARGELHVDSAPL